MGASLYAGLMAGTSADGIDACLVRFERERSHVLGHVHHAFDADLRGRLLAAMDGASLAAAASLDSELADTAVTAVAALLRTTERTAADVRAIGSHGQTLLHRPHGEQPTSVQITDPHRLAVRSGIDVVADFRRADIAAGGEGAPLAPAFHAAAFARAGEHRAVLNIGGMANLTLLPADGEPVRGFDTGPGNALLDLWYARVAGGTGCWDEGGTLAASGRCHDGLLAALLGDPYFAAAPPKSTGREHFNGAWLEGKLAEAGAGDAAAADIQATLAELTAASVADALLTHAPATETLVVCGGGVNNTDLLARLQRRLPGIAIDSSARHGIPPQQVEAIAFAWLARQRLLGRPGNVPAVTGATRAVVLGAHVRAPR